MWVDEAESAQQIDKEVADGAFVLSGDGEGVAGVGLRVDPAEDLDVDEIGGEDDVVVVGLKVGIEQ